VIPRAAITEWSRRAPWPADDQVEQDLVLSRLIVEIANHPLLGHELALRCLAMPSPMSGDCLVFELDQTLDTWSMMFGCLTMPVPTQ